MAESISDAGRLVGANVRALRKERQLTQADLAARSGIDQSSISRIEGGAREPTVGQLVDLATALGVSPAVLLGLDGGSQPARPESVAEAKRLMAEGLKMLERILGK